MKSIFKKITAVATAAFLLASSVMFDVPGRMNAAEIAGAGLAVNPLGSGIGGGSGSDININGGTVTGAATSGTCGASGDNLTWSFDSGVLTISGKGEMAVYAANAAPWDSYKGDITAVKIEEGVTSIGNYAFYLCSSLKTITLPDSLTSIKAHAFQNCNILEMVEFNSKAAPETFGTGVFADCGDLTQITIPCSWGKMTEWAASSKWENYKDKIVREGCDISNAGLHADVGSSGTPADGYHYRTCPNCGYKNKEAHIFVVDTYGETQIKYSCIKTGCGVGHTIDKPATHASHNLYGKNRLRSNNMERVGKWQFAAY